MHHVTSLHAKPHTSGACVFRCNLPPALLAEWPGSFTCYCITRRWNGYRSKSQHKRLTQEKKILPPLQQGFEPTTFQSRVRRSNHWAAPAPLRQQHAGPGAQPAELYPRPPESLITADGLPVNRGTKTKQKIAVGKRKSPGNQRRSRKPHWIFYYRCDVLSETSLQQELKQIATG